MRSHSTLAGEVRSLLTVAGELLILREQPFAAQAPVFGANHNA